MAAQRCDGCGEAVLDAVVTGPHDPNSKYHEDCKTLLEVRAP